ncbi:MAG: hypothetical protein UX10_C0005G0003 [Candidatus Magasanikbacteria bacterium GW2011_GWA2_45_39]|uniref:Uncharacterized protein n=1 Tax=Candidatus Magasanikbacteria bacterium GW2011_GWA2_45_39 TaxID=1619041 RepID=A0A0G1MI91_9BACT|nr:MAG: hypothetical protein UX10_C0005G0003 [Candidatus Magasanikbacteria bacterium GW2011_GWA2_45_39]HBW74093.1 hypothetical protein [Candidatus Magasanikbacteria bacterium]
MDKKKIALAIVFVLITILLGWGLYYFFFKTAPSTTPGQITQSAQQGGAGALPTAETGVPPGQTVGEVATSQAEHLPKASPVAQGGITQTTAVTQNPILAPHLAGQNIAFYDRSEGKFYRLDQNGNINTLSNQQFYNVQNITWSPGNDKAVIQYPDGSKISYDFNTQKQSTLPKHWQDFSFNSNGTAIAAKSLGTEPENRWLVTSNPDGTNAQGLIPLGDNADKVQVTWSPNNQIVGFSATGDARGFASKEILPLGLHNENFKAIIVPGLDFHPLWSKTGDQLLFSTYNPDSSYKPELWIVNANGDAIGSNRQPIKINTWAEKCAFADNTTIYCAVPNNLPEGAGFEPDVANDSADTIYKIDTQTGAKSTIAVPEQDYTINSMVVSPQKDALYFTDTASGLLHKIKLK